MTNRPQQLWHFNGGLHLQAHKKESTAWETVPAAIPKRLVYPLQQHIGESAEPVVQIGDHVLTGQIIATATGYVSAPVHASTSGTVVAMEDMPVPHPSGLHAPCIVIEADGEDRRADQKPVNYRSIDPSALRNVIREAGIVGLGGAGFPSFIKLNPGSHITVDTLILNGAECEPYISCDDMLMRERPGEIVSGARIMKHALQAMHCLIGIEDNKPEAYNSLLEAVNNADDMEVVQIPTIYPAGGEKQIIKVLTGMEVPSNGLPLDIGVVCHNVATAAAIHRAINLGEPMISRYVTITGGAIRKAHNMEVRIGTPMSDLLEQCGTELNDVGQLIIGGPMMGFSLHRADVPVIKTTNCILARTPDEIETRAPAFPCIRCGDCVRVCPVNLLPQQLYWYAHSRDFDKVQDYKLFDCIECGCCAYVCPSNIPLVQFYRFAKTNIWELEREKHKADVARRRHEFRLERLERDKRERKERHRRKKEALKSKTATPVAPDPKKTAIMAALERVRRKQAESAVRPSNIDNLTAEQKRLIREVDERRARLTNGAFREETGVDKVGEQDEES